MCFGQSANTKDSLLNLLPQTTDTMRIQVLNKLFWAEFSANPQLAKSYIDEEYNIAKNLGNDRFIAGSMNDFGVYYWTQSDYDSSVYFFNEALNIFEELGNQKKKSATLNNIGNIYQEKGDYDEALEYHMRSLEIKEKLEDTIAIANSYLNIANIHVEMGYNEKALDYYSKCLNIVSAIPDSSMISSCYSNMGSIYSNTGKMVESNAYYQKALSIDRSLKDEYGIALDLDCIGQNYFAAGKLDSALICYDESLGINQKLGNRSSISLSYRNIGEALKGKGEYQKALTYLYKGLKINEDLHALKELIHDHRVLADTYEEQGNYPLALRHLKKYKSYQDSVFSQENEVMINDLELKYQTTKKEKEIARQELDIEKLQKAAIIQDYRRKWLVAGLFVVLVLSGLIYYIQKQRLRRQKLESEKKQMETENELTIKKKELTSHTLHLIQKNDLLDDVSSKLKEIRKATQIDKSDINRLIQKIKNDKMADKDWDNFKLYFDQVHEDFDAKLKQYFNDLTSNEIRLAALMKMKLSTKEIASILNISPDSVTKARYRLRKKLNMNSDDRLEDFILAL